MLVDIFNKVTALVCVMQVPSLNIVNINVKLEKPSHPWAGQVSRSSRLENRRIKCQHSLGNVSWKKHISKLLFILTLGTKIILKFEIGGGNRVNQ